MINLKASENIGGFFVSVGATGLGGSKRSRGSVRLGGLVGLGGSKRSRGSTGSVSLGGLVGLVGSPSLVLSPTNCSGC